MAEHFKLEITNRSTKITTWTGVSDDFANEYKAVSYTHLDVYKRQIDMV